MYGFRELGAEIVPYHFIDEIEEKIGPEDIVLDYIEQCHGSLKNSVIQLIWTAIQKDWSHF